MKKQVIFVLIFTVFFILSLTGCFQPQTTDYVNQDLDANENTILSVKTINGQIEINVWDNDTISFNAVKKSPFGEEELEKIDIEIVENDNIIEIEAVYNGNRVTTPSVDMNIKVPREVTIKSVTTSNGAIQISDVKGNLTATTSNGAIVINNVVGYVSAISSNGNIEVKGTTGIKELTTSNLGIEAEIYDFLENISISTSNGRITIFINPALNAILDMETSNGKVTITDIALNLSVSEDKHKTGILGEGGNSIYITTSNGNIYLNKLEI